MDKKKILYERALITCLLMLAACVILKLFGADWFDLDTGIPILQKMDAVIMDSVLASFCYSFVLTYVSVCLILKITTLQNNVKLYFMSGFISVFAICNDYFIDNTYLCFMLDTLIPYICCIILDKKSTINYAICFILNIVYQLISIVIRDIGVNTEYFSATILMIMNIDYYILLVITYLYLKKGECKLCSVLVACGSSLRKKLCTAHLTKLKQSSADKGVKVDE